MIYLVDANILSEPMKAEPNLRVLAWLRDHEPDLAIDPIILGEIQFGILLLPSGSRRRRLEKWFANGIEKIRCVQWQAAIGLRWAKLLAHLRDAGLAMPIKDSMIAATALFHGFTVVTHNTQDFKKAGVHLIDPFSST